MERHKKWNIICEKHEQFVASQLLSLKYGKNCVHFTLYLITIYVHLRNIMLLTISTVFPINSK